VSFNVGVIIETAAPVLPMWLLELDKTVVVVVVDAGNRLATVREAADPPPSMIDIPGDVVQGNTGDFEILLR
jgi:hypothetical protein